jgi:predicted membrane protein
LTIASATSVVAVSHREAIALTVPSDRRSLHPLHAILLAGIVPLYVGVLLCNFAYRSTYKVQWKNFASWLIVGGLVFGGLALAWALIGLLRGTQHGWRPTLYFLLLLATWVSGFINALVHARWLERLLGLRRLQPQLRLLAVPKGSNTGTTLRLKGKAAPRRDGGHGDQFVTLKVVLPKAPDPELEAFVSNWAKGKAFNPREDGIS